MSAEPPPRTERDQQTVERLGMALRALAQKARATTGDLRCGTRDKPFTELVWAQVLECKPLYREALALAPVLYRIHGGAEARASLLADPEIASGDLMWAKKRADHMTSHVQTFHGFLLMDRSDMMAPYALTTIVEAEFGLAVWPNPQRNTWDPTAVEAPLDHVGPPPIEN